MWNAECGMSGRRSCRERTPRAIPHSAFRTPHSGRRPVTLLELLAAAAGTRIVAAHSRVGVAGEGRLGRGGPRHTHGRGLPPRDQTLPPGLGRPAPRRAAPPPPPPPPPPRPGGRRRARAAA